MGGSGRPISVLAIKLKFIEKGVRSYAKAHRSFKERHGKKGFSSRGGLLRWCTNSAQYVK
jgi:hypothetical protein